MVPPAKLRSLSQKRRQEFAALLYRPPSIRCFIAATNGHPKPFVWTKTADEISASVARFCKRICESGH